MMLLNKLNNYSGYPVLNYCLFGYWAPLVNLLDFIKLQNYNIFPSVYWTEAIRIQINIVMLIKIYQQI